MRPAHLRPLCPVCLRPECPWLLAYMDEATLHAGRAPDADRCPIGRPAPGYVPHARGRAMAIDEIERRSYVEGYRDGIGDTGGRIGAEALAAFLRWTEAGRPQGGAE